jgi:hypothetical protein
MNWPRLLLREGLISALPASGWLSAAEADLSARWHEWVRESRCRFSVNGKAAVAEALGLIGVEATDDAIASALPILEDSPLIAHAIRLDGVDEEHVSGRVFADALRKDGGLVPFRIGGEPARDLPPELVAKDPAVEVVELTRIVRDFADRMRQRGPAEAAALDYLQGADPHVKGPTRESLGELYDVTPDEIRAAEKRLSLEAARLGLEKYFSQGS